MLIWSRDRLGMRSTIVTNQCQTDPIIALCDRNTALFRAKNGFNTRLKHK
ncbi:hypothetical protein [Dapis sp. BLCC M229]